MTWLRAIAYFFQEAFVSLGRSWKVSLIAIATIGMSLFIGGLFLMLSENLARISREWRGEAKVIIYLHQEIVEEHRARVEQAVASPPWVTSISRISAEKAKARFQEIFPSLADLMNDWEEEPLPASLEASFDADQVVSAEFRSWVVEMRALPGVLMVDDDRDWLRRLDTLIAVLRGVGMGLGLLLLGAAVFTIASVIRLTSYLYRDEILVKRLVGATELYIRGPFYLEGLTQGLVGGVGALSCLFIAFHSFKPTEATALLGTVFIGDFLGFEEIVTLIALGGLAGLFGAIVSLRNESLED